MLSHTAAAATHVLEAAGRAVLCVRAVGARQDFNVLRHMCVLVGAIFLVVVALRGATAALEACAMEAAGRAIICAASAV